MVSLKTRQPGIAKCVVTLLSLCLLLLLPRLVSAQSLNLAGPDTTVREGYFTVSVVSDGNNSLENLVIESATTPDFESMTRFPALGDFKQLSLTGFSNGTYYLRARADNIGSPSNVIQVKVNHYPLWQALSLFFTGLLLFTLLVVVLLMRHRRVQRGIIHD